MYAFTIEKSWPIYYKKGPSNFSDMGPYLIIPRKYPEYYARVVLVGPTFVVPNKSYLILSGVASVGQTKINQANFCLAKTSFLEQVE